MTRSGLRADLEDRLDRTYDAIRPHVLTTPLTPFPLLSEATGAQIWLKCEHLQHTGSFKVRGALAKLIAVGPADRDRGVIAASTGNHGLGVAYALSVLGGAGTVFVPPGASAVKVAAIGRLGVEVRELGRSSGETEVLARRYAEAHNQVFVSPYNDLDVVAGQGSVGLELLRQVGAEAPEVVVVSVGGGGLASGVATAIKRAWPDVLVVGASPANDAAMAASVVAERIVDIEASTTMSDGTAGGIEAGAVTLELCSDLIDDWMLVTEEEIADALRMVIDSQHQVVEGAAAAAVAAAARCAKPGQRVVVVACGANISAATLQQALDLSAR